MTIYSLDILLSYLEPVCCSMSSSNFCFLTCIEVSPEASQLVWYSHLFQNFPQFIVIHTIKGFGVVNKAEIDISLELSCFFNDPVDVGNLISGSSAFYKTSLNIWKFTVHVLLKPGLENFEHYSASMWNECSCVVVWAFFGIEFKGMKKVGGGVLRQKEWVTAYVFDSWISSSAQSNVSQRKSFVCVEGWRRGEVVFFSFLKYNWFAMLCYFQGFS